MTLPLVALILVATMSLWAAGYAFGARRGKAARDALRDEVVSHTNRIARLEADATRAPEKRGSLRGELEQVIAPLLGAARNDAGVEVLRHEMKSVLDTLSSRERTNEAFRSEVRGLLGEVARRSEDSTHVEERLKSVLAPILAQRGDEAHDVRRVIDEALEPLLENDRVGHELSTIHVARGSLGELPALLDAIATKAGFASVVLSDEAGLPLAASDGAVDVDGLSGTAAFFVTLAERSERASLPRPLSCVVLDETNRVTLHRIFSVGETRFTLSAVSRGKALGPGALDPALLPLERVLGRRELS